MPRDVLYFTLAMIFLFLVFDQIIGNKTLSKLSDSLWNKNEQEKAVEEMALI